MHRIAFAAATLLLLAACNPSAEQAGEQGNAGGSGAAFPNLAQAAYRAEATITGSSGRTTPVVLIRDGDNMRMEMTTPQGQSAVITNGQTGERFILTSAGGQVFAMRVTTSGQYENPADSWIGAAAAGATPTGPCAGAGLTGGGWTREEAGVTRTACVTTDGIILKMTEGDHTVWETTQVERGPQSADLFALPPGAQAVDLNSIPGITGAGHGQEGQ